MKYVNLNINNSNNITSIADTSGKSRIKSFFLIIPIMVVVALGLYIFKDKIRDSFNPISIVARVNAANLKESDGRTNVLLLGSDKREVGAVTSVLTDTILIASIGRTDGDVVLISIPRDLWISNYHSKINAIYSSSDGVEGLKKTIEEITGITIHYYGLVTFNLFEESINTIGGISVNVENSFTDTTYPIEGKENAPDNERYQTVSFTSGQQTMDGATALKFARSRHGDNGEGTDFARAKRQQQVIAALKNKVFSAQTLLNPAKVKSLYDSYSKNVDTDIDFSTVQSFYLLAQQVNLDKVVSIVLQDSRVPADQGGLLYSPTDTTLYGGQWVLIPQTGDYSQIHAYVQRYLFGNK